MSNLKLAIQKSGRLKDDSLKILRDAGIYVSNGNDQLKVIADNFPIEIYFLRNSDIPQYIEDGVVDAAIIGQNTLAEKQKQVKQILPLGFSKCRLSLALAKDAVYDGIQSLDGAKIATSYPNTLRDYFNTKGINCDIHFISGSVEIAPNIGLADAICDLVSSGSTLFKNGLKEVEVISQSVACLATGMDLPQAQSEIVDQLVFRIQAVLRAKNSKYVLMNVPNESIEKISNILPVLKSPTILPLAQAGWSSLHSVIEEKRFWEVIEQLKTAGAEDILIVPIEKMVL